jgi:dihydroorotate dehydrogenase (fumarate)
MTPSLPPRPDLSARIAGVRFPFCLMNASGALCVTQDELEALGRSPSGAIVTKSMTREPRSGNPEPRYFAFLGGSINSMGLPNLGYHAYAELIPSLKAFGKPVIASVAGLCEDDFPEIVRIISKAGPDLIEVNLSCPNIPGKPQIGYDVDASERVIRRVRAAMLHRTPVDFLSLINSVGNTLIIDPERESVVIKPKGGFGGLGGAIIKPVALANVRAFAKALQGRIPIIGVGGIVSGTDAFEHLLAGASAVQIGTALVDEGLKVFDRIGHELEAILAQKGYRGVESLVGSLHEL